jgi:hypothetical protein
MDASILVAMRFAKVVVMVVVSVALGAYGFDCRAMTTPEQSMQCCASMPCAPGGHTGQDCCKTMATIQLPFMQPSAGRAVPLTDFGTISIAGVGTTTSTCSVDGNVAAFSHAPPIEYCPASLPIRI